jgi:hypothetical protein
VIELYVGNSAEAREVVMTPVSPNRVLGKTNFIELSKLAISSHMVALSPYYLA